MAAEKAERARRGQALGDRDDAALGRAHVGDERTGGHAAPDRLQQPLVREHGGREHHTVGALDAGLHVGDDAVDHPRAQRALEPPAIASHADDLARHPIRARGQGDGAAQEPDADDRQPSDHAGVFPNTVLSAFTSRRFSSGVPTVTRSADSMPNGVIGRTITPSFSRR